MRKPKILMIYTGGTFGMDESLKVPKIGAKALKTRLLTQIPEMKKIAAVDVEVLFNLDSCQMGAYHWFTLAAFIHEKQKKYDGVVVLHGTDTLSFSAAALSLLLSPTEIPIVITGALKPLSSIRNDARQNFLSALEVAAHAPEPLQNRVMVVFHDEVFLGSRVRKRSSSEFAAFESPRFPLLARVGNEVQYDAIIHSLPKLKNRKPLLSEFQKLKNEGALPLVLPLNLTPEFPAPIFDYEFLENLDAILLTLYSSGTAPTERESFIEFLERASESHTPLIAITEGAGAHQFAQEYEAEKTLKKMNVLDGADLTREAAMVKIWLLKELSASRCSREQWYSLLQDKWTRAISDEVS